MSSEIAGQITSNLLAPMRRALFPGYAKIATDLERLGHMFVNISALVFLVGTPLTLGIGVTADLLVRIALGDQWLGAIPLIEILAAKEFLQLISAAAGPIYLATGRPNYMMVLQIFHAIVIFPLLIFGVQWAGALGAAWATLAGVALMVALDLFLCLRLLSLSIIPVLVATWRPLISGALMLAAVAALETHWRPSSMTDSILLLCACIMVGAVIYSASLSLLWMMAGRPHGAEYHLVTLLKGGSGMIIEQVRSALRRARAALGQRQAPRR
jgi:O-antigen/teichoic acid export membrane protein